MIDTRTEDELQRVLSGMMTIASVEKHSNLGFINCGEDVGFRIRVQLPETDFKLTHSLVQTRSGFEIELVYRRNIDNKDEILNWLVKSGVICSGGKCGDTFFMSCDLPNALRCFEYMSKFYPCEIKYDSTNAVNGKYRVEVLCGNELASALLNSSEIE